MKTRKLVRIASVLAIVVMSFSISQSVNAKENNKDHSARKSSHMTYDQASQVPGILTAMYEQIDDNFLPNNWPDYTARIKYKGSSIYIQGSYEQWFKFFRDQLIYMRSHRQ